MKHGDYEITNILLYVCSPCLNKGTNQNKNLKPHLVLTILINKTIHLYAAKFMECLLIFYSILWQGPM